MNIFNKIDTLVNLTNTESILIDYIKKNPEEFISLKPKEISSKTFVSVPTIYRLINKLGLNGINELKVEIKSSLKEIQDNKVKDIDFPILPSDTQYEIMLKLKEVYQKTIEDTLDLADPETLVLISKLMEKSESIDVYTSSANVFFAENFKFQMQEIKKNVKVPKEDYIQRLTAANSSEKDFAIVISFGGRGLAFNNICKLLKKNNVPILLITSTNDNPLVKYADYKIYMSSYENHYNKISSFSTRMTLLYILDTLYSVYFNTNYEENLKTKIESYELLSLTTRKTLE